MLFGTAEDKCAARRAWDHDWISKAMLHNNCTLQPDSVVFGENKCNDTTLSFPQGRSFSQRSTDICWILLFLLRPLSPALFILLFFVLLGSGCVQEMDKNVLWECFSERPTEEDRLPAKHNRCSVAPEVWFHLLQILTHKDLSVIYTKRHFLLLFFTVLSSHLLCTFLAFISSNFLHLTSSLHLCVCHLITLQTFFCGPCASSISTVLRWATELCSEALLFFYVLFIFVALGTDYRPYKPFL